MAMKAAGVALPLLSTSFLALSVSSLVVGALVAGTTTLCSGWILERVGVAHHRQVWGWMTSAFAVAQAGSAWGCLLPFAATHSYSLLFALGAAALASGAALAAASARTRPRSTRHGKGPDRRSEEHTSELQSLMRISYAVFCLKK